MRLIKSFQFALTGLSTYIKTGGNVTIHLIAATIAITLSYYFQLNSIEWTIIILCIGLVLTAEAFNTSIELLTDLVSPNYHKLAGKVKDIAAAAVLIISIAAALIGLIIFLPKIQNLLI